MIRLPGEPEAIHPPPVRTPLVDWATCRGPATIPPPQIVAEHLERLFVSAEQAGKRQGIARGALVCAALAVTLVVVALLMRVGAA